MVCMSQTIRHDPMSKPAVPSVTWRATEFRGTLGGSRYMIDMFVGRGLQDQEAASRKAALGKFFADLGIEVDGSFDGDSTTCCFNLTREEDVVAMQRALPQVMGVGEAEVHGGFSGVEDYPGHMDTPKGITITEQAELELEGKSGPGLVVSLRGDLDEGQRFGRISKLCQVLPNGARVLMNDDFTRLQTNFDSAEDRQTFADVAVSVLAKYGQPKPGRKGPGAGP
ncbi:MAG: hypothetical protein Alpg2KO_30520 [Alphaproteobacteria bacterium]